MLLGDYRSVGAPDLVCVADRGEGECLGNWCNGRIDWREGMASQLRFDADTVPLSNCGSGHPSISVVDRDDQYTRVGAYEKGACCHSDIREAILLISI